MIVEDAVNRFGGIREPRQGYRAQAQFGCLFAHQRKIVGTPIGLALIVAIMPVLIGASPGDETFDLSNTIIVQRRLEAGPILLLVRRQSKLAFSQAILASTSLAI